jgi:parallel beta-helix repeat protein
MKKSPPSIIMALIVFAVFLWIQSSVAEAATTQVDCSSASLQAAIEKARPGDTLLVSGTCEENLVIYEEVARITLDGQGKATIKSPDAGKPTIEVRGRGITIKGFTVTGSRRGISVLWGGRAVIDGNTLQGGGIVVRFGSSAAITNNTVQNSASQGIGVTDNSVARIINNTVKNSRRHGITVIQSSSAWVGVLALSDKTPRTNILENNGMHGIVVVRSSSARIVGNTIRSNKRDGIHVMRASVAHISSNTIDANGRDGITVSRNSHVSMKSGRTKIFRASNSTTSNNSGFGISCTRNSDVDGLLGSLIGKKGKKNFDPSCVDRLKP